MEIVDLENSIRRIVDTAGCFAVLEYERDASVTVAEAGAERVKSAMGIRRRQLLVKLDGTNSVVMEAGAMQWTAGDIRASSGLKGPQDVFRKWLHSRLTDESMIKPKYEGEGIIALEPTYKFILLQDVGHYGPQGMTISDGMFLACDDNVQIRMTNRKNVSSAVIGNEGLFNTNLTGNGIVALKSNIPQVELLEIRLNGETLKLDGSMAVCWSTSLDFTVESNADSLVGFMLDKEGFVNVYHGTGIVLISPVAEVHMLDKSDAEQEANPHHHHLHHVI